MENMKMGIEEIHYVEVNSFDWKHILLLTLF